MCPLSTEDQYVCEINQGLAETVTSVLGSTQFPAGPFYHPRSSCGRFGHPRETSDCAGNVPDSNGIIDDGKRRNRSHHIEPVPSYSLARVWPFGVLKTSQFGERSCSRKHSGRLWSAPFSSTNSVRPRTPTLRSSSSM